MIQMHVMGIAIDTRSGAPIVILNDEEERKALPIWIGQAEASAIIRILDNVDTPRPMTHDLLCNIIDKTGSTIEKIEINDLNETTYYATLFITDKNGKRLEIDSRPSDAIAISLRNNVPIFVTPNVVMDGTISTDIERDEKETEEFKDFLKDIKPSDFKKLINDNPFNEDEDN